ncbi:NAD-dependent epimerase/dehydratase family protein [Pandoraea sp. XJJ-1]|uniref:NAD-dependent epimerase/dehydratase family protein n=1 Tax=Pandoraea sp. XJJ-1 TaxID=3002643 RepID=UPI00227E96A8|nr:NAD-dependent epimerase/dehydratase family protein [Pandoraea sp. XJJ-1]WAL84001.1 NAD-dependent epimerase/dehydratase family protein [Pandoraea sp. XJJ-1]
MKIFLTGATGYIGGTLAKYLLRSGHSVRGLVRNTEKAQTLNRLGITPVLGSLEDTALLSREAAAADAVINTANADDEKPVKAFIEALRDSGKAFIHTSGSSVIADNARGASASERVFDENSPFVVNPFKQARFDLDQSIIQSASLGIRSIVICPSLIYGVGSSLNPRSLQIPTLVDNAVKEGRVEIVGAGANRWSNVHIQDLIQLYRLALEESPAGAFYFAENGDASFIELGNAISKRLDLDAVHSLSPEAAKQKWGERTAFFSLGSNSRVRANRARVLGWRPLHNSAVEWILNDMPMPN